MESLAGQARVQAVTGEIRYLAPESPVPRRFMTPGEAGEDVNTGTYRVYEMPVHSGRTVKELFALDVNGFEIVMHTSAVRDFTDREEIDRLYLGEVAEFVRSRTGADRVATIQRVLRRSAQPRSYACEPQARVVHGDFSDTSAVPLARDVYARNFPQGPGYRRALITSLWRVFSPPPQDWPLVLCDYTSVAPDDGLESRLYVVSKIPGDLYAEMPSHTPGTISVEFRHNPAHQWWYFPDMTRDEVLFFKLIDSDHARAWRVPHSSFPDPGARATQPRHSIEVRTIAYFE